MAGDGEAFDPSVYDGKCVVLRIDGAVKQFRLTKTDHRARIGGKETIFDAGPESVWGTEGFDQTKLCYAKPSPGLSPGIISNLRPTDWLFGGIGVLFVILLVRAIYRSRVAGS